MLGQHRSTQRKLPGTRDDEGALIADIVALALQYGRYGYRRIAALLRDAGWALNLKHAERIWRREGLKVPMKQPKRKRLWLNDGSWTGCGRRGRIDRKLNSTTLIDVRSDLFILRSAPGYVRPENVPEFIAKAVQERIAAVGSITAYIEPRSS